MKKHAIILAGIAITALLLPRCGGKESKSTTESSKEEYKAEASRIENTPSTNMYAKGEEIYNLTCKACHQANGEGLPATFPPLAHSDYLLADKKRAIKQVITGSSGEITVNGVVYNSVMPPLNLGDEQIADVLNYVLHSWGNNGETVTAEEVKALR